MLTFDYYFFIYLLSIWLLRDAVLSLHAFLVKKGNPRNKKKIAGDWLTIFVTVFPYSIRLIWIGKDWLILGMYFEILLQRVVWIILQKIIKSNHSWLCLSFDRKTFTFRFSFSKAEVENTLSMTLAYKKYKLLLHIENLKALLSNGTLGSSKQGHIKVALFIFEM